MTSQAAEMAATSLALMLANFRPPFYYELWVDEAQAHTHTHACNLLNGWLRRRWYHFCISPSAFSAKFAHLSNMSSAYNWSERCHGAFSYALKPTAASGERASWRRRWSRRLTANEKQSTNHSRFRSISTQYTHTRTQDTATECRIGLLFVAGVVVVVNINSYRYNQHHCFSFCFTFFSVPLAGSSLLDSARCVYTTQ